MIVQTKLSDQSEQFELDGACYVGRRVLCLCDGYEFDLNKSFYERDEFKVAHWKDLVLFQLDYDRGLIFVDPSILKPYQRPENLQAKDA